jgi:hypothetical protein
MWRSLAGLITLASVAFLVYLTKFQTKPANSLPATQDMTVMSTSVSDNDGRSHQAIDYQLLPHTSPTQIFRVPFGAASGQLQIEQSDVDPGSDVYARRFVRDRKANVYFLEPGPVPRISVFTEGGIFIKTVALRPFFSQLSDNSVIMPHDLFHEAEPAERLIVVARVFVRPDRRLDSYKVVLTLDGRLEQFIKLQTSDRINISRSDSVFLDRTGTLWVAAGTEGTHLFSADGSHLRTLERRVSYVTAGGAAYTMGTNPVSVCDAAGRELRRLHLKDDGPGAIAGELAPGFLWGWLPSVQEHYGDITSHTRTISILHVPPGPRDVIPDALGIISLPPAQLRIPNPHQDLALPIALFTDRLVSTTDGMSLYWQGRDADYLWLATMRVLERR